MNENAEKELIGAVFTPFRWDLLGFGFCRAWIIGMLAYSANEIWTLGASFSLQVLLFFSMALVAFVIALISKESVLRTVSQKTNLVPIVALVIGLFGLICIILGKYDSNDILFGLGFLLMGLCGGYFETVWGAKFVELTSMGIQVYTFFVIAISSLLGIVMGFLSTAGFFLVSGGLLFVMGALYLVKSPQKSTADKDRSRASIGSDNNEIRNRSSRALLYMLVTCLVFSLIYNLVVTLTYASLPSETASQIRFWANLIAALILLCSFLLLKPISIITLFRLILPITAVGFVLYLISPTTLGETALMISSMGRKFFDILTWILVARAVQEFGFSSSRYFGLLIAGKNLGYMLGLLLATPALMALDANIIQVATFIPVLILVLIVCFFWLFPERTIDHLFNVLPTTSERKSHESAIANNAKRLAEKSRLTPRETEVFMLMAKGKNQSAVMRTLNISKGTVHTHITHIYQKLGVNKHQQLIELVEQFNELEQTESARETE